jgi:hypothetical protein
LFRELYLLSSGSTTAPTVIVSGSIDEQSSKEEGRNILSPDAAARSSNKGKEQIKSNQKAKQSSKQTQIRKASQVSAAACRTTIITRTTMIMILTMTP